MTTAVFGHLGIFRLPINNPLIIPLFIFVLGGTAQQSWGGFLGTSKKIEKSQLDCWRGFAWCAIVLPEMVSSVPGASVMAGDAGLGLGSVGVKFPRDGWEEVKPGCSLVNEQMSRLD